MKKESVTKKTEETSEFDLGLDEYADHSAFEVDPQILKHLADKGLAVRWINASEHKKKGGFNARGWQPVTSEHVPADIASESNHLYGFTAEGFMIRNDMMLAVRPLAQHNAHKAALRKRARNAQDFDKNTAEILDNKVRGHGGKIIRGF